MVNVPICYLCSKPIKKGEMSRDHVPPLRFFPRSLREKYKPNLITLPTHKQCNESYKKDEEYFYWHLGLWTLNDPKNECGKAIYNELNYLVVNKKGDYKLLERIKNSISPLIFPPTPTYPEGRIKSNVENKRIERVVWKITRGIFFYVKGYFLPENKHKKMSMYNVLDDLPEKYKEIISLGYPIGDNPLIFSHKLLSQDNWWSCSFYIWDFWFFSFLFHDPSCDCKKCKS